ncbi:hypothetical protein GQ457_15G022870 [Hibiscus cannabinus]
MKKQATGPMLENGLTFLNCGFATCTAFEVRPYLDVKAHPPNTSLGLTWLLSCAVSTHMHHLVYRRGKALFIFNGNESCNIALTCSGNKNIHPHTVWQNGLE